MVLAEDQFRDSEYIVPFAFWQQFGAEVKTTATSSVSYGKHGYEVHHDFHIHEAQSDEFDGLFFVGGNGCLDYLENESAQKLAASFLCAKKPIGAICAAPRLLLSWGILEGKKCTGFNGDGKLPELCEKSGALFQDASVVTDQNICTGTGPNTTEQTALAFWEILTA